MEFLFFSFFLRSQTPPLRWGFDLIINYKRINTVKAPKFTKTVGRPPDSRLKPI